MKPLILSCFQRRGTENIVHHFTQICVSTDFFQSTLGDLCAMVVTFGDPQLEISGTSYVIHAV